MLTGMTEDDWATVPEVFDAVQLHRGEPGHNDRKFLKALHYFTVHNITWRALPAEYGPWNSVWKRFWRLSRSVGSVGCLDATLMVDVRSGA
jgi:transposase